MKSSPKLVALDIDGTLVETGDVVSAQTREAVALAARSAHVVLATGRTAFGAAELVDALDIPGITAVCSNGAVLRHPDGQIEIRTTFDPEPVVVALDEFLPGAAYAAEVPGFGNIFTELFKPTELSGKLRAVELSEIIATKCPRLVAKWPTRTQQEILSTLSAITLPGVVATLDYGTQAWLTCVASGTSKASALEELRAALGVSNHDTAAIGDGTNDIEMLAWAARSAAMGQSPDIVMAAADCVTGTVAEHGVAATLHHWFG